jgi:manganese efflux pump family protein
MSLLIDFATLLLLALGLSVDTFAAALTKGATTKRLKRKEKRRVAAIFTACAVVAPALGWAFGSVVADHIRSVDHWIAFALLAGVGAHMVYNGLKPDDAQAPSPQARTMQLFLAAIATNIDAVAVGIGLAFTDVNILMVSIAVALVTVIAVYLGMHLGKRTGKLLGHKAEILGGLVLIALGLKILLGHLVA